MAWWFTTRCCSYMYMAIFLIASAASSEGTVERREGFGPWGATLLGAGAGASLSSTSISTMRFSYVPTAVCSAASPVTCGVG